MKAMAISKAASKAGSVWRRSGFMSAAGLFRSRANQRVMVCRVYPDRGYYAGEETVQRIRFIRQAQEIGFKLREIDELLSLQSDPSADCADVRDRAAAKLEEVNRKILQLENMRGALEELIAACPASGALRACSILQALGSNGQEEAAKTDDN